MWRSNSDPLLDSVQDRLGAATSPAQGLDRTKKVDARIRDQVTCLWIGWSQASTVTQPWLHNYTNDRYAKLFCFGMNDFRSVWIDRNASNGRVGRPV